MGNVVRRALLLATFTVLMASGTAQAQQYPPSAGGVRVSSASPRPGESFTVTAEGFAPASPVTIRLASNPPVEVTVMADAQGRVFATLTVPKGAVPGPAEITITGRAPDGSPRELRTEINIGPQEGGLEEKKAPRSLPLIWMILGLAVVASVLVIVVRQGG